MSTLLRIRLSTTLDQGVPSETTPRDTQGLHFSSKRRHKETQGRQTLQDSILDGSSVGHRSHTLSRNGRMGGDVASTPQTEGHPQLTNNYIALINPLQHFLKEFKGTLRWTPAHPEKRNSMLANWSRDDCLNHIADRVAGGLKDFDIDCQRNFIQLQEEDIMESLISPNSWTLNMKDGSTQLLAGLQQQIGNWRLVTYLHRREENRAELIIPRPPRWTNTTPVLAAQIYDVHNSSLLHASHSIKLIWDKH